MMRFGVGYAGREQEACAEEVRQRVEKSFQRRAKELGYEVTKIDTPIEAP